MSIAVPYGSDFILARGRMAQETRRRRMSEPAVPSSVPMATARRRNTLDTTASTSGLLSPPTSPLPASQGGSQMLTAMMLKNKQRVAPLLVGKMATILPPKAQQKTKKTACDQQEVSSCPLASPMSPPADQLRRYYTADAAVSPALASIPEDRLSGDAGSYAGCQQVTPGTAHEALSAEEHDCNGHSVSLIVLDNKKIRLARPRIIHIPSSPSKQ
ncbi:hypothetical protein LPJ75_002733 [Coemansia sp. RSA 2598]|nr:hypothetical protein LPJ75_002733 [Coemansia sp. RSA 2598]